MTPENAPSPRVAGSVAASSGGDGTQGSGGGGRDPFAKVPEWLLYAKVSDRAVRLYAVLARHRNDRTARCDPGRDRLAALLNCSTGSVDRAVKELVGIGAVTVEPGHGAQRGTNSYTLHPGPPSHVVTGDELAPSHVATRDELGHAQVLTGEEPKSSRVRTKREEGNEKTDVAVRTRAHAAAPAGAPEPEAFAEAVAGLSPKGPQRGRWLAAFGDHAAGFLAIVREARTSPGVRKPEGFIDSQVTKGEHLNAAGDGTTVELPPLVQAEQFVTRSGWQFEDDDLADRLTHDYGLEQAEREALLYQARDLRATRLKEAA